MLFHVSDLFLWKKGPNKFSHKGNFLVFGKVASASAHPARINEKSYVLDVYSGLQIFINQLAIV